MWYLVLYLLKIPSVVLFKLKRMIGINIIGIGHRLKNNVIDQTLVFPIGNACLVLYVAHCVEKISLYIYVYIPKR